MLDEFTLDDECKISTKHHRAAREQYLAFDGDRIVWVSDFKAGANITLRVAKRIAERLVGGHLMVHHLS